MNAGGYRYIPGVMQYSAGVAAVDGFRIVRVCLSRPVLMDEGFRIIQQQLSDEDRPLAAFCACELRSPAQFSESAFQSFNCRYADVLREWGIMVGDDNPVARSNVCPAWNPPDSVCFHAFSYTVEDQDCDASFVIAGSGEAPEGHSDYASVTIRHGDTSESGIRDKARFVIGEMERRMSFFKAGWVDTTAVQLYTVHDAYQVLIDQMTTSEAARNGITWHNCRPPVVGLDFEMDCRRVLKEEVMVVDSL